MRIDGFGGEEDRIVSGDEENRWEWRRGGQNRECAVCGIEAEMHGGLLGDGELIDRVAVEEGK